MFSDTNGHCLGKEAFATREEATKVASLVSQRRNVKAQAYRCTKCGNYHVGTTMSSHSAKVKRVKQVKAKKSRFYYDEDHYEIPR